MFKGKSEEELAKGIIFSPLALGMLCLPVQLLQYKTTGWFINEMYRELLEQIPKEPKNKGDFFEALWLIDRLREKKPFKFLINGMVIVDPNKPKRKGDENEFDVIDLSMDRRGKAECHIYACSVADDYESKNIDQLDKLAKNIREKYRDLSIEALYVIPENKKEGKWKPKTEQTGIKWDRE